MADALRFRASDAAFSYAFLILPERRFSPRHIISPAIFATLPLPLSPLPPLLFIMFSLSPFIDDAYASPLFCAFARYFRAPLPPRHFITP
jgi:hypothetical protein